LPCEYPLDTEIVLLGTQGDETITIEDIAGRYNTVHVDFMMGLTARVPRVYYWE
jgi:alanine racemase